MRWIRVRGMLVVAAFLVTWTVVACSSADPQEPNADRPDGSFESIIAHRLGEAERFDASADQIALLEDAQQAGEVSVEVYNEAIDNSLRCLREAGYDPYDGGMDEERGFPERNYSVPVEAEAEDARELNPGLTVHRCVAEHSIWVEFAYQNQPTSVEAEQAHRRAAFEPHRDAIVECAMQEGIEVDPDGDILDIVTNVWDASREGKTEVDCTEGIQW